jgi:phosphopantothenoylcysteine decarboxylase/phosphopantothenate--cysteine ligase
MRDAVLAELPRAGVVVMAAAVADFRPADPVAGKLKKEELAEGAGLELRLVQNPDILAEISRERGSRIVVGFAAESRDVIAAARRKLARKGCDLLVANDVSRSDAGFESDQNAVAFLAPDGDVEELPLLPKREVAVRIWDRIEKLLGARRA